MTETKLRLLLIIAAIITIIAIASAITSHISMRRLENSVQKAAVNAALTEQKAAALEQKTYEYKQQILSLENRIETLRIEAQAQDDRLDRIAVDTDAARRALADHRQRTNRK